MEFTINVKSDAAALISYYTETARDVQMIPGICADILTYICTYMAALYTAEIDKRICGRVRCMKSWIHQKLLYIDIYDESGQIFKNRLVTNDGSDEHTDWTIGLGEYYTQPLARFGLRAFAFRDYDSVLYAISARTESITTMGMNMRIIIEQ